MSVTGTTAPKSETVLQEIEDFGETVKETVEKGIVWVEGETKQALVALWGAAKPIFVKVEPVAANLLMTELASFMTKASEDVKNGTPAYIAQVFTATLRDTGHSLLGTAETLGEDLLTVFAGLAKSQAAA